MSLAITLHVLSVIIWIGGTFFFYYFMRPVLKDLDPSIKIQLMCKLYSRFFAVTWVAIFIILFSGFWIVFNEFEGFQNAHLHIHVMLTLGTFMILLFCFLYVVPFKHLKEDFVKNDIQAASRDIETIRKLLLTILILGFITTIVGTAGRYW